MRPFALAVILVFSAVPALAQEDPCEGFIGDGFFCDCGCGVADTDCTDTARTSCDFNNCADGSVPRETDPTQCTANTCGDSVVAGDELCDDGNAAGGGCSADCTTVEEGFSCEEFGGCRQVICGDGVLEFFEEDCDDGNDAPGDGCDASCVTEDGFVCDAEGQPCRRVVCGDGQVEPFVEGCDDGNSNAGDGCDATCQLESPEGWDCPATYYGTSDGCDCGCGIPDPDCESGCANPGCGADSCEYCYEAGGEPLAECPDPGTPGEGGEEGGEEGGDGEAEAENDNGRNQTEGPKRPAAACGQSGQHMIGAFAMALLLATLRRRR